MKLQVGRAGQKKKVRMARTRSDFLTRAPSLSVGGDSDEADYEDDGVPRHSSLPFPKPSAADAGLMKSCFSDSEMVTGAIQATGGLPPTPSPCALKARLLFDISNPPTERQHGSTPPTRSELQHTFHPSAFQMFPLQY